MLLLPGNEHSSSSSSRALFFPSCGSPPPSKPLRIQQHHYRLQCHYYRLRRSSRALSLSRCVLCFLPRLLRETERGLRRVPYLLGVAHVFSSSARDASLHNCSSYSWVTRHKWLHCVMHPGTNYPCTLNVSLCTTFVFMSLLSLFLKSCLPAKALDIFLFLSLTFDGAALFV